MLWRVILFILISIPVYAQNLDLEQFVHELSKRQSKVEEFQFIKKIATQLGIKNVYMFGGTAAAWAHYVRWDMQRELGIENLQPERFDYDYTNIFRANQDFDVVIDGTIEQAEKLEQIVQDKFKYFSGARPTWEVRLLNEQRADKDPIMGSDFQNQHTDSHSTGLIEMLDCESFDCIKDVRDFKKEQSQFLLDVYEAKLHYYFNDKHEKTSRFLKGMNPEILSVIRFFTKAVQYELEIRPEDLVILENIIQNFNPRESRTWDSYVGRWLEKNAKKLIVNAIDMEFAQKLITDIGLKSKLIQLGDVKVENSMAWWLNKQALVSKPVGKGRGRKAKDIFPLNKQGQILVAHETNSFSAFESITKAHDGSPNVLISRKDVIGEAAAYGDGHYVRLGNIGARGTGLTIRYILNPEARLHSDFDMTQDYLIIKNRNALRVIYEKLDLAPVEYLEKIIAGIEFDFNDKGVLEKLKRRIKRKVQFLDQASKNKVYKLARRAIINDKIKSGVYEQVLEVLANGMSSGQKDQAKLFGLLDRALENPELFSITVNQLRESGHFDSYIMSRRGILVDIIKESMLRDFSKEVGDENYLTEMKSKQFQMRVAIIKSAILLNDSFLDRHDSLDLVLESMNNMDSVTLKILVENYIFKDEVMLYNKKWFELIDSLLDNRLNLHSIDEYLIRNKVFTRYPTKSLEWLFKHVQKRSMYQNQEVERSQNPNKQVALVEDIIQFVSKNLDANDSAYAYKTLFKIPFPDEAMNVYLQQHRAFTKDYVAEVNGRAYVVSHIRELITEKFMKLDKDLVFWAIKHYIENEGDIRNNGFAISILENDILLSYENEYLEMVRNLEVNDLNRSGLIDHFFSSSKIHQKFGGKFLDVINHSIIHQDYKKHLLGFDFSLLNRKEYWKDYPQKMEKILLNFIKKGNIGYGEAMAVIKDTIPNIQTVYPELLKKYIPKGRGYENRLNAGIVTIIADELDDYLVIDECSGNYR